MSETSISGDLIDAADTVLAETPVEGDEYNNYRSRELTGRELQIAGDILEAHGIMRPTEASIAVDVYRPEDEEGPLDPFPQKQLTIKLADIAIRKEFRLKTQNGEITDQIQITRMARHNEPSPVGASAMPPPADWLLGIQLEVASGLTDFTEAEQDVMIEVMQALSASRAG